jgi:hypothetical protein
MLPNTKFPASFARLNICLRAALAIAAAAFSATGAYASLTISTAPTKNVACSSSQCTQVRGARADAFLNVTQLENMLALSSVSVAGLNYVIVDAPITWVSSNTLALQGSLKINKPITVEGAGGLLLGGPPSFVMGPKGKITFWSTSSSFIFGPKGESYTLVNSIAALASAVAGNVAGNYALANDYDASADGTYASSPIPYFRGNFIGLNHTISNLSIADKVPGHQVGLFGSTADTISFLNLRKIHVSGANDSQVGGIAGSWGYDDYDGVYTGYASNVSVEGVVSTGKGTNSGGWGAVAGEIVGVNDGAVFNSFASGSVRGGKNSILGGAIGEDTQIGSAQTIYSTASVTLFSGDCKGCVVGGPLNSAGGLVGVNYGGFDAAYATGAVTGGASSNLGSLVGFNASIYSGVVASSYSTGAVTGGLGSSIGGSIGFNQTIDAFNDIYWDTTTSGISDPSRGVGNVSNASGVTGMTTAQLKSGLPAGFPANFWREKHAINGGLPYLLAIPPK